MSSATFFILLEESFGVGEASNSISHSYPSFILPFTVWAAQSAGAAGGTGTVNELPRTGNVNSSSTSRSTLASRATTVTTQATTIARPQPTVTTDSSSTPTQTTTTTQAAISLTTSRGSTAYADEPRNGPYVDKAASKNVSALLGKTAYLNCRVKNLANKTVSGRRRT